LILLLLAGLDSTPPARARVFLGFRFPIRRLFLRPDPFRQRSHVLLQFLIALLQLFLPMVVPIHYLL